MNAIVPRVTLAPAPAAALEGGALNTSGFWTSTGGAVTVTASVGTVSQGIGTWSWTATRGDDTTLRYRLGDDVLEYRVSGGRLQTVRRLGRGGGVAESIDLTYNQGAQTRAQYRDWAAFRTLILTIESSRDVEPFPDETWRPAGT